MTYGYVDSSVIARIAFNEPDKIRGLSQFSKLATSELAQVELRRILDRFRLVTRAPESSLIAIGEKIEMIKRTMTLLNLTRPVLMRAGHPLPVVLGTLDAIHLSSALTWQDLVGEPVKVLTHDVQLAKACKMMNLETSGI